MSFRIYMYMFIDRESERETNSYSSLASLTGHIFAEEKLLPRGRLGCSIRLSQLPCITGIYLHIYIYIYIYVFTCAIIDTHIYICSHIYIYMHTYIQPHFQKERERGQKVYAFV